jgi:hypothetical protein
MHKPISKICKVCWGSSTAAEAPDRTALCQIDRLVAAASDFDYALFAVLAFSGDPKLGRHAHDCVERPAKNDLQSLIAYGGSIVRFVKSGSLFR